MNTKIELNPFTGKELNPNLRIEKNGKVTVVAYVEDYFKKTGVYDHHIGRGVQRLNQKLTREEWGAVRKYFKNYNRKFFKWGSAEWDMVIIILVKMRNPDVDSVVVRHKMTADGVKELKEKGMNIQDGLTGEWLIPLEE